MTLLVRLEKVGLTKSGNALLEDISFDLHRGEMVTIVGPNGAGKSSLAKIIAGLMKPSLGSVAISQGIKLGYMPQWVSIDRTLPLTVLRFLQLYDTQDAAKEVLQAVGASSLADRSFHALSGGERQRVLFARALLCNPDLLILDEPVQGVDISGQNGLYKMIASIAQDRNCGVLMISHDLHVVFSSSDRVICLNRHVCCEGKPEAVAVDPEYQSLFGKIGVDHLALYTHSHDHDHDPAPDDDGGCNHA